MQRKKEKMCIEDEKKRFCEKFKVNDQSQIFKNVIKASFQHSRIYGNKPTQRRKKDFYNFLEEKVEEIGEMYVNSVNEETHFENIKNLSDCISSHFGDILEKGRFRIGTSQKILNLYLKCLWCQGKIPEPPHCPIDRNVLQKVKINSSWTNCDSIEVYKSWIEKIKCKANRENTSIAKWELKLWNQIKD